MDWGDCSILVTGGTGSFGHAFTEYALARLKPRRLVIFSRDELKQSEMAKRYPPGAPGPVRYLLGDVRDPGRLRRAMQGVDVVIHAAALKQVPACEYNAWECMQTNVIGTQNVIEAAIDAGARRVMLISTDKAVAPVNTYGVSKAAAERLVVQGNALSGGRTKLAVTRYGNVAGSRGSVIPLFKEQAKAGAVTITDPRMTRFWITLDEAVAFVARNVERMVGGEVYVPKIPSVNIIDLAQSIAPHVTIDTIGIRPGEKLHEVLVSADEARHCLDIGDAYVVTPSHKWWEADIQGRQMAEGWEYRSDKNAQWLTLEEIEALVA